MTSSLKFLALSIPTIILALLLGRMIAIEIYAAKFPRSPLIEQLRANPLRVLSVNWL
tara:strand:+ start:246 stop:416 length:171 start_codon:yes stop_codon:yes gene_type:complete